VIAPTHISPAFEESCGILLRDLYAQPGVSGTCLQLGATILAHDLAYADAAAATFAAKVNRLMASYEGVGRGIWQVVVGFESIWLIILTRDRLRLTVLLKPGTDPAQVATRGTRLLLEMKIEPDPTQVAVQEVVPSESPAEGTVPREPTVMEAIASRTVKREDFERALSALMGRVTGTAQATKLMQMEFKAAELNGSTTLTPEQARRIGRSILQHIPNRGKREALTLEFVSQLDL